MKKRLLLGLNLVALLVACPQPQPSPTPTQATWNTNVTGERGNNGKRIAFTCPAQPVSIGVIWGTDVYTDDSAVCAAALHVGKITAAGGNITVEIRPGQATYTGSTRNGVTSLNYGVWSGSYVLVD